MDELIGLSLLDLDLDIHDFEDAQQLSLAPVTTTQGFGSLILPTTACPVAAFSHQEIALFSGTTDPAPQDLHFGPVVSELTDEQSDERPQFVSKRFLHMIQ